MAVDGILGKKIGMTQIFREDGRLVGVTAVQAGPCTITQIKLPEKDKYTAVQLGFHEVRNLRSPERGHLRKAGRLYRHLREVPAGDLTGVEVGDPVGAEIFSEGEHIDAVGTSKGRGFTGGVKRHNFAGGTQDPRSVGPAPRAWVHWVRHIPGPHLARHQDGRHYGAERVTVRNLEIIRVDSERNLVFVKGAIPGPSQGLVILRRTNKAG